MTGPQCPEPEDPDPLDELNPPPVDRYCDVVLTGGVTDGVVYPWAVLELAREYRFKDIGGTSVGAMAAALTAAAEYGRRYGSLTGFNEVLLKLPRLLGEDIGGKTRLFTLFQPVKATRNLFEAFVGLAEMGDMGNEASALQRRCKICIVVWALLRAYRCAALFGALLGLLIGIGAWWYWHSGSALALVFEVLFSAIPCAVVLVLLLVGLAVYRDLVGGFVDNGFGLCTGYRNETTPPGQQSLVEWLHEGIQAAAGKTLDQPLTFKDLWDAPGGPVALPMPPVQSRKSRSIDLRMVTTNLTHGRPYGLPLDDQTSRLFFREVDLRPYFPESILKYLLKHSCCYAPRSPTEDPDAKCVSDEFREMPKGQLPIVVAARLSLSFPVLFSAIPLWAIDYEPELKNDRQLRRCWFSDGGICSNFPIHLFDSAMPRWPTFGISLGPKSIFRLKERIWLPNFHDDGRGDRWDRFGDEILPLGQTVAPLDRLLGFIFSIVYSAKDWNDKTSMRMPGVRDRVVRLALDEGEGGLNLKLTRRQILDLAGNYGQPAGRELVKKFIDPAPGNRPSTRWSEHRWVRFNSLLVGLRERIEAIRAAAELADYAKPLSAQISEARLKPPLCERPAKAAPGEPPPPVSPNAVPLTAAQADALMKLLAVLTDLESKFARAATPQPYQPIPTPHMRVRPPL